MTDRSTTLSDRIAFAERWLGRARRQLEEGEVAHGTLTVMLAEAELHHAREEDERRSVERRVASRRMVGTLLVASAVTSLAVALVGAGAWPPPEPHAGGPPFLTLNRPGAVLGLVPVPEPARQPTVVERIVERTVVRSIIVRVPAAGGARLPDRTLSEVRTPVSPAVLRVAPPLSPAVQTAPPAAVAAPPGPAPALSEADVIELVLAAERSLRRAASQ